MTGRYFNAIPCRTSVLKMACCGLTHLLVVLLALTLSHGAAVDTEFPSLVSVLGSKMAFADDYYDYDEDARQVKESSRPCCFPPTWQGKIVSEVGSVGGPRHRPSLSHAVDQVYIDGRNQRIAGNKAECQGHGHGGRNFSYIFKVTANSSADLYLFDPASKKCAHRTLSNVNWRSQCIPANATLDKTFSLGPSGVLKVESWSFRSRSRRAAAIQGDTRPTPRPRVAFAASIAVVPSTCVPVLMHERGIVMRGIDQDDSSSSSSSEDEQDDDDDLLDFYDRESVSDARARPRPRPRGIAFASSIYFADVQPRISDPHVFDVPDYCKTHYNGLYYEGNEDPVQDEIPTILERFIVL